MLIILTPMAAAAYLIFMWATYRNSDDDIYKNI